MKRGVEDKPVLPECVGFCVRHVWCATVDGYAETMTLPFMDADVWVVERVQHNSRA